MCRKDGGRWGARGRDKRQREGVKRVRRERRRELLANYCRFGMLYKLGKPYGFIFRSSYLVLYSNRRPMLVTTTFFKSARSRYIKLEWASPHPPL
jgi:hypothetical protein